jgi:hypothetical protein
MDTNQAEEQSSAEDWQYWDREWPSEEIDERKAKDINFFNTKGKGKGKGNQLCYNCNQPGHRAFECPHPKRERNEQEEKESGHQKEEKEKAAKERQDILWTKCGTRSEQSKERVEAKEKDSKAIAKGAANSAIRPRNAERPCQSER